MTKDIRTIIREELSKLQLTTAAPQAKPKAHIPPKRASNPAINEIFRTCAKTLYGEQWQRPVSIALGVSKMAAHHWAHDLATPRAEYVCRLFRLMRDKREALDVALRKYT